MNFSKFIHEKESHNESLNDLENVLQRNLRTGRARRECILKLSEGTNFENFSARGQPWWHLQVFTVCTGLPKKNSGYAAGLDRSSSTYSQKYVGT